MKILVPYEKEITFDSKIAEISSISLEHEMEVNKGEIEGNFIISGEYKSHEVSVNKEQFNYKLPFSVEVTDNIVKDSVEFEITDFTYEVLDEKILKVNVEFSVSANEMEEEKIENDRDSMMEEINDLFLAPPKEEKEEKQEESNQEETNDKEIEEPMERLDQESTEMILDSASQKEDEFTTYFIHVVKPGDTIESIVTTYQTDVTTLQNYNSIENINVGDKIIIPSVDE